MRLSFRLKIFVPLCLLCMGLTGLCVAFFYNRVHANVKSQLASRLKDIGRVGQNLLTAEHRKSIQMLNVRSEELSRSLRTAKFLGGIGEGSSEQPLGEEQVKLLQKTPEFRELAQIMRRIKNGTRNNVMTPMRFIPQSNPNDKDVPQIRYVYIVAELPEHKDRSYVKFICDGDHDVMDMNKNGKIDQDETATEIGMVYNVKNQPALREAFTGVVTSSPDFFSDTWGTWFSSFTPIKDEQGRTIAVMGVDMSAYADFNFLNQLKTISWGILVASFVLSLIAAFLIAKRLSKPVALLREGAERVRNRDFSTQIQLRSRDELGLLAETFNSMVAEIRDYSQHLEEMVQTRTRELQEALQHVQALKDQQDADYFLTTMLANPLFKNYNRSQLVSTEFLVEQKKRFQFKARTGELGGDLCVSGNLNFGGNRWTMFLNGDAMGKSMQGAGGTLVMGTVINSIMSRSASHGRVLDITPEQWLEDTHRELQEVMLTFDGSMYVSCVLGLIEDTTGRLLFFNAEHPFCVLYRGGRARFIEESVNSRKLGMPLQTEFSLHTLELLPGDVIVVGSDGRDDLQLSVAGGMRQINEDSGLFLRVVERARGNLAVIREELGREGEMIDDLSLIRIGYKEGGVAPQPADFAVDEVVKRIRGKDYAGALELLDRPDSAALGFLPLYYRGLCLARLGRLEEAARALEEARVHDREQALVFRLLGRVYADLGRLDDAEHMYVEAVALNETNEALREELAAIRGKKA